MQYKTCLNFCIKYCSTPGPLFSEHVNCFTLKPRNMSTGALLIVLCYSKLVTWCEAVSQIPQRQKLHWSEPNKLLGNLTWSSEAVIKHQEKKILRYTKILTFFNCFSAQAWEFLDQKVTQIEEKNSDAQYEIKINIWPILLNSRHFFLKQIWFSCLDHLY